MLKLCEPGVGRVIERLVHQHDSTARTQHTMKLGDGRWNVCPMVHRVHCPQTVAAVIGDVQRFGGSVEDHNARPGTLPHPAHPQYAAHERRWFYCDHDRTGASRRNRGWPHTRPDINDALAVARMDHCHDCITHRRSPHAWEVLQVTPPAAEPPIGSVTVTMTGFMTVDVIVIVFVRGGHLPIQQEEGGAGAVCIPIGV